MISVDNDLSLTHPDWLFKSQATGTIAESTGAQFLQ